jgi:hypothetical protein
LIPKLIVWRGPPFRSGRTGEDLILQEAHEGEQVAVVGLIRQAEAEGAVIRSAAPLRSGVLEAGRCGLCDELNPS